ncbi:TPA: site-specific DNA-methyltransferase [Stenotrophomonas maltophilia]|nr:site-specific DNA-methyltransferase [Stenotrophomonas maltophilia]
MLSSRLPFGLNFERHSPEAVELPVRPIRKGDKVRVLPPRGETKKGDQRLWQVKAIHKAMKMADLELLGVGKPKTQSVSLDDLVVVAEFRDLIHPGLVSTGKVTRGGDKPFHTVINGENYHVLKALTYTHRGKVDAIYIDPPYNTGAKDWKYNNDYVAGDDLYRHSKWLAMMERRLLVARELLNPADSVLIVTIDEKEYLRLGLLIEQAFPEARVQMISSVINPKGAARSSAFGRTDEYLFFVMFGRAAPTPLSLGTEWKIVRDKRAEGLRWADLLRSGSHPLRSDSPNQFYPIFIRNTAEGPIFHSVGEAYFGNNREEIIPPAGTVAVWPIRSNGTEGNWSNSAVNLRSFIEKGYARLGRWRGEDTAVTYLARGEQKKVDSGHFPVVGRRQDNSIIVDSSEYEPVFIPGTQWRIGSHNAEQGGTNLQKLMMPDRKFPFPKSLYAVEDALRFFIANKPEAVILDFFSGSGTTAHAVMRLNKQDGGRRQCISVTNNEVAADEQKALREQGLRPGDDDWEKWGICDYITKPRVQAAITGKTPDGEPIKGDYKFTDEFPMADGFEENAEFFTLTYEAEKSVGHNLAYARIAPLLWLRAGAHGKRIDKLPVEGWAVVDAYGLLAEVDKATPFIKVLTKAKDARVTFIVTDDDRRFQSVAKRLPKGVEPVRLYESYLTNFSFTNGE